MINGTTSVVYSFLEGNELNIAFPFVILMSYSEKQATTAQYLDQFQGVESNTHIPSRENP